MTTEYSSPAALTVAVLTYKRPALLGPCLHSLAAQELVPISWRVVVVDNDPAESARELVGRLSAELDIPLRYVVEPVPGIAAGRNRAVHEAAGSDFLAFIDDDETAEPGWIRTLLAALETFSADVVQGLVISDLEPGGPRWATTSGLFCRTLPAPGTSLKTAATNNVLLRSRVLEDQQGPFRVELGLIGSDDTDLFCRLASRGVRIVSEPRAIVRETIPRSRQSFRWFWTRSLRAGAGWVEIERTVIKPRYRRIKRVLSAGAHLAAGLCLIAGGIFRPRSAGLVRGIRHTGLALGTVLGLAGRRVTEYRRR